MCRPNRRNHRIETCSCSPGPKGGDSGAPSPSLGRKARSQRLRPGYQRRAFVHKPGIFQLCECIFRITDRRFGPERLRTDKLHRNHRCTLSGICCSASQLGGRNACLCRKRMCIGENISKDQLQSSERSFSTAVAPAVYRTVRVRATRRRAHVSRRIQQSGGEVQGPRLRGSVLVRAVEGLSFHKPEIHHFIRERSVLE